MRYNYRFIAVIVAMMSTCISILTAQQAFWKQMNISLNENIYTVIVTPQGQMFAGTDKGVYCSTDTGKTWIARKSGLPNGASVGNLASDSRGTVFAGVYTRGSASVVGEGIYRLASSDTVWKVKNSGLNILGVSSLGADQKNNIIYAGTYKEGAYRFQDTDTMWQRIDTTSLTDGHLTCFLVDTVNGYTYAGTWSGVFRSTNFGTTWARLGNSTTFIVRTMAINSKGYIYAGSSNYGVFRSTNNGINWVPKNPVMMDSLATNIVVNSKDIVYANTQGGIFSSTNNGDSWTALSGNLRRTTYLGLDADQYLYVGTSAGSVYRTISTTATGVSVDLSSEIVGYRLDNNYPNPFNPSTMINYQLPVNSFATLKVYDVLGREVAVLVNEVKNAGIYSVQWNASQFSSGVYFARFKAGEYLQMEKMILLK